MSLFEHRKPSAAQRRPDLLNGLRATLEKLEAESEETPQMAELKRILSSRIAELERRDA